MSFSKGQQPEFRRLVALAWREYCKENSVTMCGKMDRAWYEAELRLATGKDSSTECNPGADYENAMSHFEALSRDGMKWQMKRFRGAANRIEYGIRQLTEEFQIAEDYMQRIARQSLRLEHLPELHTLTPDQLLTILRALKQHVTRKLVAGGKRDPQISRKTRQEKRPQARQRFEQLSREEPDPDIEPF